MGEVVLRLVVWVELNPTVPPPREIVMIGTDWNLDEDDDDDDDEDEEEAGDVGDPGGGLNEPFACTWGELGPDTPTFGVRFDLL